MYVTIAEAIRAYSPSAWVINYTNPMSVCVKTLYRVFPQIKAFGCCHEVFGTQKILKQICEETFRLKHIDRRDIIVNVLGINHFTWFDQASYKGIDLFPVYRSFIEKNYEEGYLRSDNNWANNTFECAHRVKFDLFQRYGLIAAAGDRHLAEFMPGKEYLKDPETVKSWRFGLTSVAWRKNDLCERLERSKRLASGEEELELCSSGEEGVLLLKALCGLGCVISNVNIPNSCLQIANLPALAVVETNAVFSKNSIKPVHAGTIPSQIRNLMLPHIENHETILEAALNCNKEQVIKAFLKDPLVKGRADDSDIELLAEDMIKNTLSYLPGEWRAQFE